MSSICAVFSPHPLFPRVSIRNPPAPKSASGPRGLSEPLFLPRLPELPEGSRAVRCLLRSLRRIQDISRRATRVFAVSAVRGGVRGGAFCFAFLLPSTLPQGLIVIEFLAEAPDKSRRRSLQMVFCSLKASLSSLPTEPRRSSASEEGSKALALEQFIKSSSSFRTSFSLSKTSSIAVLKDSTENKSAVMEVMRKRQEGNL